MLSCSICRSSSYYCSWSCNRFSRLSLIWVSLSFALSLFSCHLWCRSCFSSSWNYLSLQSSRFAQSSTLSLSFSSSCSAASCCLIISSTEELLRCCIVSKLAALFDSTFFRFWASRFFSASAESSYDWRVVVCFSSSWCASLASKTAADLPTANFSICFCNWAFSFSASSWSCCFSERCVLSISSIYCLKNCSFSKNAYCYFCSRVRIKSEVDCLFSSFCLYSCSCLSFCSICCWNMAVCLLS